MVVVDLVEVVVEVVAVEVALPEVSETYECLHHVELLPPPCSVQCADGSRPTCSDGTEPQRRRGAPPCDDDLPPLTCVDGSTPVDEDGDPFCAKEERLCCDETVLDVTQGRRRGPRPRCNDGSKPVCSVAQCSPAEETRDTEEN